VLEKGDVVGGRFDTQHEAELVVQLDRGGPHVISIRVPSMRVPKSLPSSAW
jgi:hypothetical protein